MDLHFENLQKQASGLGKYFKEKPGWCLFCLAFLLFVYGLVILGSHAFRVEPVGGNETQSQLKIELYQNVIVRLKQRQINIQQGTAVQYPDIFR